METRTVHDIWDDATDVADGLCRLGDGLWTAAEAVEDRRDAGLGAFRMRVGVALDELDRLRTRLADLGERAAAMEYGGDGR